MELEKQAYYASAKRKSTFMGLTLLAYYMILNAVVMVSYIVDIAIYAVRRILVSPTWIEGLDINEVIQLMTSRMMTNFWGYILAIGIGILILLLWKKKSFWKQEIWAKGKPMTAGTFFVLLVFVIGIQAVPQILYPVAEFLLNKIGLSAISSMEMATITGDSLSMFLYASLIGPFAEEILFRGLILRSMKPVGKQFAICASAFLFAMFHGNIIQIPYAFCVGLLLGYIAVEYSILWAIIYHVFNNFVLADLLSRLTEVLSEQTVNIITNVLIYAAAVGAVVIGILRRREIRTYFKENPLNKISVRAFFTSPTVLIFSIMMLGSSLLLLFM